MSGPTGPGFWALQRQAWGTLPRRIVRLYRARSRASLLVTVAALVTIALGVPGLRGYINGRLHEDDIRITSLDDSKDVPVARCLRTLRGVGQVPEGHHLWIAVQFPRDDDRIVFALEAERHNGKWRADDLDIGGEDGGGQTYTIAAVDVDAQTNRMLTTAKVNLDGTTGRTLPPGEDLWRLSFLTYPSGARPRADVSVTRSTTERLSCEQASGAGG